MSLVNVAELMTDPDFAQAFTLRRPSGSFTGEGVYSSAYDDTEFPGIVQPASPEDLKFMPEGARLTDVVSVWSACQMTAGDGASSLPDVIVSSGKSYRVIKCEPWGDNGYFRVFAEGFPA